MIYIYIFKIRSETLEKSTYETVISIGIFYILGYCHFSAYREMNMFLLKFSPLPHEKISVDGTSLRHTGFSPLVDIEIVVDLLKAFSIFLS